MPDGTNFGMAAFTYGTNEDYLVHVIAILQTIKKKGLASEIKVAWDDILEVRREMKPYFQFPEGKTEAAKSRRFPSTRKSSRLRRSLRLPKPKRHSRCSVCLLLAIRKPSGTKLSTKCTPRTPGLELTEVPTRALVLVPGHPSWTALSSTSSPSSCRRR
jgi:hypothetical protein